MLHGIASWLACGGVRGPRPWRVADVSTLSTAGVGGKISVARAMTDVWPPARGFQNMLDCERTAQADDSSLTVEDTCSLLLGTRIRWLGDAV